MILQFLTTLPQAGNGRPIDPYPIYPFSMAPTPISFRSVLVGSLNDSQKVLTFRNNSSLPSSKSVESLPRPSRYGSRSSTNVIQSSRSNDWVSSRVRVRRTRFDPRIRRSVRPNLLVPIGSTSQSPPWSRIINKSLTSLLNSYRIGSRHSTKDREVSSFRGVYNISSKFDITSLYGRRSNSSRLVDLMELEELARKRGRFGEKEVSGGSWKR